VLPATKWYLDNPQAIDAIKEWSSLPFDHRNRRAACPLLTAIGDFRSVRSIVEQLEFRSFEESQFRSLLGAFAGFLDATRMLSNLDWLPILELMQAVRSDAADRIFRLTYLQWNSGGSGSQAAIRIRAEGCLEMHSSFLQPPAAS